MLLFVSSFEVNKNASYRKRCARVSADTVSFMLNFSWRKFEMRILLTTAPRSVKGAWSVDGVRLSVCRLSSVALMWGLYENYQTNQRDNLGQCWDYATLSTVLWCHHKSKMTAAANLKIIRLCRHYDSENDPIMIKFGTLTQIVTDKTIWPKFKFLIQDGGRTPYWKHRFGDNMAADYPILRCKIQ